MKLRLILKDNKITSVVEDEYNNTTYSAQAHMVGELDELLPIIRGSGIDYSLLWHDNQYMDRYNIDDYDSAEQISNHPSDATIIRKAFVVGDFTSNGGGLNIVVKHYNGSNEYIPDTYEDVLVQTITDYLDNWSWNEKIKYLDDQDTFNSSIY